MSYIIQEQMCGIWVCIEKFNNYKLAKESLAILKESHPDPIEKAELSLPGPRYRIQEDHAASE